MVDFSAKPVWVYAVLCVSFAERSACPPSVKLCCACFTALVYVTFFVSFAERSACPTSVKHCFARFTAFQGGRRPPSHTLLPERSTPLWTPVLRLRRCFIFLRLALPLCMRRRRCLHFSQSLYDCTSAPANPRLSVSALS